MPTIRRCCIVGCMSNSRQNPQLQFFQFPRPDNPFHKLWKQACHASLSRILPFKKPVLCALHFNPNCLGGRRLTSSAVPSLRLEVPSNLKAVEQQAMLEEIERSRKCAYINAVVYEWIVRANLNPQLRGSITHGMIKEKAENAKQIIGSNSFMADNRWLNRFRETHLTGFAQKLATNQLKPIGPSLRIADIVQDLQHLFPPTTAERMAKIEDMPEQYINYMQEYGDYEEDEEGSESKDSSYLEQQQQQAQYHFQQQQFSNGHFEGSFAHGAFPGTFEQYSYESQQQQHHQQLQQQHYQQQQHALNPFQQPYHHQYHHQQQQQQQQQQHHHLQQQPINYQIHEHSQTNYSSSASSQRSASRTPPNPGAASNSPNNNRSPSNSPTNRNSPSLAPAVKRPRIETPTNVNKSPSTTRNSSPSNVTSETDNNVNNHDETTDLTGDNDDDEEVPNPVKERSATPSQSQTNGDSTSLKSDSGSRSASNSPSPTIVNDNSNDNEQDNDNNSDNGHMNGNATPNENGTSESSSPAASLQNGKMNGHVNGHANTNGLKNGIPSPASSLSPKELENYTEALEYLRPLEDFALLKENFRAIGLISQLEVVLRKGIRIPHNQAS